MAEQQAIYVTHTEQGGWRVAGTRISLDSIVHAYWSGRLPEVIAADFPGLTLEQIYGAIAYYLKHRLEIDEHLVRQQAHWRQFQQESSARHNDLLERMAVSPEPTSTSGQAP